MPSSSVPKGSRRRNLRRSDFIPELHEEPPFKFDFSKSLLELCGIQPIKLDVTPKIEEEQPHPPKRFRYEDETPIPMSVVPVEKEPSILNATAIDDIMEESTSEPLRAAQKPEPKTPTGPIAYGALSISDVAFALIASVSRGAKQIASEQTAEEPLDVTPKIEEEQPQLPKPVDHPFGKRTIVSFKTPGDEVSYADQSLLTSALAVSLNSTKMDVIKLKSGWNRRKKKAEERRTPKVPAVAEEPEPEAAEKPKKKPAKRKSMAVNPSVAKGKMFTTGSPLRKRHALKGKPPKARLSGEPCSKSTEQGTLRRSSRNGVPTMSRSLGQRVEYVCDENGLPNVKKFL
ncbi:hypothetical protein L596_017815 [Steinernema carpocapsae]|uniref:Uncharacterized protein n=1 Tax=Steinernema carpocapsae TaxID=34508 RepID=A0A4U5N2R5_STECR|nr:hypothetical protein L596_017815 [Steinernema carpocapsae]